MAAASKPSAVHYWLVAFVLLSVVLGLCYYPLFSKNQTERVAEADRVKKELAEAQKARDKFYEEIEALKKAIGHGFEKVGTDDPANPTTVLGAMAADISNAAPDVADKNFSAALRAVALDKQNVIVERDDLRKKLDQEHQQFLALQDQKNAAVGEEKKHRDSAEADVASLTKTKEEELAAKDQERANIEKAKADIEVEFNQSKDAWAKSEKTLQSRIKNLEGINKVLRDELQAKTKQSFEVADGVVRWVDNVHHVVWVNVGESDNLHKRTTFSVYKKSNNGMGSKVEDIKGAIEVTNILGPHLAEARITKDDIYNPMAPGDPIYTPLWSPGHADEFAFVGVVDLDGDGKSDRDLLHEVVAASGASIVSEVDDQGNRSGGKLTEVTKFLVLGKLPNAEEDYKTDADKKIFEAIQSHNKAMRQEAEEHAVRMVPLSDFLNYIGFKNQRRLFTPGDDVPFMLKAGAHSKAVNETLEKRKSVGTTSELFDVKKQKLRPKTSTGTTSKLFRGH